MKLSLSRGAVSVVVFFTFSACSVLISFVFKIILGTGGMIGDFPMLNSDRSVCADIYAVHIGASFIMQEDAYSGFSSCSW